MSQYFDVNDPMAAKTQWTPLKPGGFNFVTHTLVEDGPSRLVMKRTGALAIFGLSFAGVGVATSVVCVLLGHPLVALLGLPFIAAGLWVLTRKGPSFDGHAREFEGSQRVAFASIHALQVIKEEDEDLESYELNLVLTSGERINVTDHSGRERVKQDAQRLGGFIGCKVWDTTASRVE